MIEFYRPADCETCQKIETALKEMVVAHKIIVSKTGQDMETLPLDTPLPAIKENDRIVTGQANIAAYLDELAAFVHQWQKFQSDSCYCDE